MKTRVEWVRLKLMSPLATLEDIAQQRNKIIFKKDKYLNAFKTNIDFTVKDNPSVPNVHRTV